MKVLAGRSLLLLAFFAAVLSCGLLISVHFWWALLAVAVCAGWLGWRDYRWLRRHLGWIEAELSVPQSVQQGEFIDATVVVRNPTVDRVAVMVRPILPELGIPFQRKASASLGGDSAQSLRFRVEADVRGRYAFGDVYLRVTSPLGMLVGQACRPSEAVCKVYPQVERVREYLVTRRLRAMTAPHMRRATLRGMGSDFESLRDYEPGDDIRRIDWRATAKHRKLITRNYEIEPFRNVLVIVDRGRLMAADVGRFSKLDCAVDSALMLSAVALDGGDRCGLLVFDSEVGAYLSPRGTLAQLTNIVEALYDVTPVMVESHFLRAFGLVQSRLSKRSLIVVLTDFIDEEVSRSTLASLLGLSKRHMVVVAALRTPAVHDVVTSPVTDRMDPFRKAAAYRLVKERAAVVARLRKQGVHVLDVDPAELTAPLVNEYIAIREQNRL